MNNRWFIGQYWQCRAGKDEGDTQHVEMVIEHNRHEAPMVSGRFSRCAWRERIFDDERKPAKEQARGRLRGG
jgi:hypothetical protein